MKSSLLSLSVAALLGVSLGTAANAASYTMRIPIKGISSTGQTTSIVMAGNRRQYADGTYASSCLSYLNGNGSHSYTGATGDGVYNISASWLAQGYLPVYCDMKNGGWTLVMRGYAKDSGNEFSTTGDVNVNEMPSPTTAFNWKYSDTTINSIPKSAYRLQTSGTYSGTYYASGSCVYHQTSMATGACLSIYSDAALQNLLQTGTPDVHFNGISDTVGGNSVHVITCDTYYTPITYGWVAGNGVANKYADGGYPGTGGNLEDLLMWVR